MLDPVWGMFCETSYSVLWHEPPQKFLAWARSEILELGASLLWGMITALADIMTSPGDTLTHVRGQNVKSICQAAPLAIVWFHQNILKIQKLIFAGQQRTGS